VIRRAVWGLLLTSALLVLAALAAGWYVVSTESGLRAALRLAQRLAGGALTIGAAQGRLRDEFALEQVHFADTDGTTVDVRRLVLRLRLDELPQHRLHIESAHADGLRVRLPPPSLHGTPHLPTALPLDLVVDALDVNGLQMVQGEHSGPDTAVLETPRARLAGRWLGDRLEIARLDASFEDTGPFSISARGRMRRDRIEIAALKIAGAGQVQANGIYGVGPTPSDLHLQWQQLQWPLTGADPRLRRASGQGRVQGSLDAYRFELDTQAQSSSGRIARSAAAGAGSGTVAVGQPLALHLTAHGSGDLQGLQFDDLLIGSGSASGSLHGNGRIGWDPEFSAQLTAAFSGLDPGVFVPDWSGALNGTLEARTPGQGAATTFSLAIERSSLRGHSLALRAQGSTDFRQVQLRLFQLQSGRGSVNGSGTVGWSPALRVDVQAQVQSLDPAQFLAGWSGDLNGSVQAVTRQRDGQSEITFAALLDGSQLRGAPLKLSAHGVLRGQRSLNLQDLALTSGGTVLSVSGQATPPFALRGSIASSGLEALQPDLGGSGSLQFTLEGPLDSPHLVAKGAFDTLRFRRYRIRRLSIDADLNPDQRSHLAIGAAEAWAGLAIHQASLAIDGSLVEQHAELHLDTERGGAALAFDGGYDRARREWGGSLGDLRFAPTGLPPWTLEHPAGLLLGAQRQSLEPACLSGASGRACLRLEQNVTRAGLRLSWNLERLLLASLQPVLPPHYSVDGHADGSGSIEIAHGDVAAVDAKMHVQDLRVQVGDAPPLVVLPSTLSLTDDAGRLHLLLDLHMPQGTVGADVSAAPAADYRSRGLSGELRMRVPDLGFVSTLMPELQHVAGTVDGALQFGGSIGLPKLAGALKLADGRAHLVTPAIDLEHARLRLSGNGAGPLLLDGSVQSGGGTLSVDGSVDPAVTPPRADLRLRGADFQAMATPDAHIWITPDLHLLAQDGVIHVDGSLTVPKAQITPHGFGDNGVSVSADQVIVGAEPAADAASPAIFSTVQVRLGEAVGFAGLGLTARMTGAVTLNEQPQRETLAQGELGIAEGRYKAYGQDLQIQSGRLIFDGGPVTEPAVDIYATRRPQADITVGVRVRGTLDRPMLTLDSDPPMAREQQLSWLVLGRALDQTSTSDSSMVTQAALSLGLAGSDDYVQRLGKGIGLDQVALGAAPVEGSDIAGNAATITGSQAAVVSTAQTNQAAQLTLGKYLTPKLLVSYGVSLFQPGQTFRLLYDLGHGFKLQGETGTASGGVSGTATGGDVLYTVEKGR
jgi:translocation and assembly module TamB